MTKRGSLRAFGVFMAGAMLLPALHFANAQTAAPKFVVTWKASGSYIPSFYQGKALPTFGSKVTASLALVSNGQQLNLQSQTIYWYLNDNLVGGGVGATHITFTPTGAPPSISVLKVELPNWNGSFLVHAIQIPLLEPQVVIYAPYPAGQFSGSPLTVSAYPYFWNTSSASNLSYTWSVNGETGTNTENPDQAQINLPGGTPAGTNFAVALTVKNIVDSTTAFATKSLTYVKQL